MKTSHIFLSILALMSAGRAAAQFSMNPTSESTTLSAPIGVAPGEIDARIVNDSEAKLWRKALWRHHNAVDFKVSVTGMMTQFNKAWTKGNQNAISGDITAYYYHTYHRGRHTSTLKFDGVYGMNYIDSVWFKNQDLLKLYYLASWAVKTEGALKNWAYSFSTSFGSQFTRGYKGRKDADRHKVWSNFMAPGVIAVGVGLTYTSPYRKVPFIVTINPVSGSGLFVTDRAIDDDRRKKLGILLPADAGAGKFDYSNYTHKIEGGSSLTVDFNRTFAFGKKKGFTLQYNTTLGAFYGWMTQLGSRSAATKTTSEAEKRLLPTVNWVNAVSINPIRFLTLEFRMTTLYDRSQIDRVQMQYYLRVGLTYRYKNK